MVWRLPDWPLLAFLFHPPVGFLPPLCCLSNVPGRRPARARDAGADDADHEPLEPGPDTQEQILFPPGAEKGRAVVTERSPRPIVAELDWRAQRAKWGELWRDAGHYQRFASITEEPLGRDGQGTV